MGVFFSFSRTISGIVSVFVDNAPKHEILYSGHHRPHFFRLKAPVCPLSRDNLRRCCVTLGNEDEGFVPRNFYARNSSLLFDKSSQRPAQFIDRTTGRTQSVSVVSVESDTKSQQKMSNVQDTKIACGATRERTSRLELHDAARRGDLEDAVRLIRREKFDVNALNKQWRTPLHLAAHQGHVDVCKALIRLGANVNAENFFGARPLHAATIGRNIDLCRLFIEHGAVSEAQTRTQFKETALDIAINARTSICNRRTSPEYAKLTRLVRFLRPIPRVQRVQRSLIYALVTFHRGFSVVIWSSVIKMLGGLWLPIDVGIDRSIASPPLSPADESLSASPERLYLNADDDSSDASSDASIDVTDGGTKVNDEDDILFDFDGIFLDEEDGETHNTYE